MHTGAIGQWLSRRVDKPASWLWKSNIRCDSVDDINRWLLISHRLLVTSHGPSDLGIVKLSQIADFHNRAIPISRLEPSDPNGIARWRSLPACRCSEKMGQQLRGNCRVTATR